jgi:hypothetical protein
MSEHENKQTNDLVELQRIEIEDVQRHRRNIELANQRAMEQHQRELDRRAKHDAEVNQRDAERTAAYLASTKADAEHRAWLRSPDYWRLVWAGQAMQGDLASGLAYAHEFDVARKAARMADNLAREIFGGPDK